MNNIPVKKRCVICGNLFETLYPQTKFCSQACKNKKIADRTRLARKIVKEQELLKLNMLADSKQADRKLELENIHKRQIEDWKIKAESGDLFSKMNLALEEKRIRDYWSYYRDWIIQGDKEFGKTGIHIVAGFNVYDCDFVDLVMESLKTKN